MTNALLIARRDLGAYFHGYSLWFIFAGLLCLEGLLFSADALGPGEARYSHEIVSRYFYYCWGFGVVASVILTMRSIAEERRDGTDVLLTTSTASDAQVVFGKWLAAMGVLTLFTLLSAYLPGLVVVNGKVSMAHLAVGYLGVIATMGATAAIGVFGSSLFRFQLAAGLFSGILVVTLVIVWILAEIASPPFGDLLAYSAIYNEHYLPFSEGRLNVSGLVYYGSLTGLFLMLATRVLEGRRWD